MTTIFSNNGDVDSQTLRTLFEGIPGNKIVEVNTPSVDEDRPRVEKAIYAEDDTLIICGHGCPCGFFTPGFSGYLIDKDNYKLIHAKRVLVFWCYASDFFENHPVDNLVCSDMFISSSLEAKYVLGDYFSQDLIDSTDKCIYNDFRYLILSDIPMKEWVDYIKGCVDADNPVDVFNRGGFEYFKLYI